MQYIKLALLGSATLLAGCVTPGGAKPAEGFMAPPYDAEYVDVRSSGRECESPLKKDAKKNLTPSFSYGCFCGAGHPALPAHVDKREQARQYFEVKPLDEIDAACQMHDICWTLNGQEVWCDDAFTAQLDSYTEALAPLIGFWEVETEEWRCRNLARDIKIAAMATFPSFSANKLWGVTMISFKVAMVPLTMLYAGTTAASWNNYPHSPCDLERLRAGNTEHPFWRVSK